MKQEEINMGRRKMNAHTSVSVKGSQYMSSKRGK